MSMEALSQVLERAINDDDFRRRLQTDFEDAVVGYDLTAEERAALRSGDSGRLEGLGVDKRLSKGCFFL